MQVKDTSISCNCTHLTDFAVRFKSIIETNDRVFSNIANIFSLEGLKRSLSYFIFAGVLLITIISGSIYFHKMDLHASQAYSNFLRNLDIFPNLEEIHGPEFFIDSLFPYIEKTKPSSRNLSSRHTPSRNYLRPTSTAIFCNIIRTCFHRLPHQHQHLSVYFRFDPLLPRVIRFLFLITVASNTLFVTALLYGYSNITTSSDEKTKSITPIESVVLSLLTLSINIPIVQLFIRGLRWAGRAEFNWRYPYLAQELRIRQIFENEWARSSDNETLSRIRNKVMDVLGKSDLFQQHAPKPACFRHFPIKSFRGTVFFIVELIWIAWTFFYLP